MRQTAIGFRSQSLELEGVLSLPEGGGPIPGAVALCHAHPALGGSMEEPVILAMARELAAHGIASLRFNFRGVGKSGGSFSNGEEEPQDVAAALDLLAAWPGLDGKRLGVAGYSFGALAVLKGFDRLKKARAFVFVSPPLSALPESPVGKDKRPRLFLVGERDRLVGAGLLRQKAALFAQPAPVEVTPGADHVWRGREALVGQRVGAFFAQELG